MNEPLRAHRRWWRRLMLGALMGVLGATSALALLNTRAGRHWAKARLLGSLEGVLPGAYAEEVSGFLPFWMELHRAGVDTPEGERVLTVPRVRVDFDFLPLLRREVRVDTLTFFGPQVHIAFSDAGDVNVTRAIVTRGEVEEPNTRQPWTVTIRELRAVDGRAWVPWPRGPFMELKSFSGVARVEVRKGSLAYHVRDLEIALPSALREGVVRAQGSYRVIDGVREAGANVMVEGLAASDTLLASAALRGDVLHAEAHLGPVTSAQLVMHGAGGPADFDGSLRVSELDPSALTHGWPQGRLHADVRFSGNGLSTTTGSDLQVRATIDGAVAGVVLDDLDVGASLREDRWTFTQRGAVNGVRARAHGSGRGGRGRVEITARTGAAHGNDAHARLEIEGDLRADAELRGEVHVDHARLGPAVVRALDAKMSGRLRRKAREIDLTFDTGSYHLNGGRVRATSGEVHLRSSMLTVRATARVAGLGAPLRVGANLPVTPALHIDRTAPMKAWVEWRGVELAPLTREIDLGLQAREGRANLQVSTAGSVAKPTLRVRADWQRAQLERPCAGKREALCVTSPLAGQLRLHAGPRGASMHGEIERDGQPWLSAKLSSSGSLRAWRKHGPWHQPVELEARVHRVAGRWLRELLPYWPERWSNLTARADVSMRGSFAEPRASIDLEAPRRGVRLRVEVQGTPETVTLQARGFVNGESTLISNASLGTSVRALARGDAAGFRLEANGTAALPLASLRPELRGTLRAAWNVAGPVDALHGSVRAHVNELRVNDQLLGRVESHVQLASEEIAADVTVHQQDRCAALISGRWHLTHGWQLTTVASAFSSAALEEVVPGLAPTLLSGRIEARGTIRPTDETQPRSLVRLLQGAFTIYGEGTLSDADLALYFTGNGPPSPSEPTQLGKLDDLFRAAVPFRVGTLRVVNATLRLVDAQNPTVPVFTLRDIHGTVENLASRRSLMRGLPAVVTARATLERSGHVHLLSVLDPHLDEPVLTGQASLRGLQLNQVNDYLRTAMNVEVTEGTFAAFTVFQVQGNHVLGAVLPIMRDAEIEPAPHLGWWRSLGIELADLMTSVIDGPNDRGLGTVLPMRADLRAAKVRLFPTLLSVVRNAFVDGLASAFWFVAPGRSRSRGTFLEQAAELLSDARGPGGPQR